MKLILYYSYYPASITPLNCFLRGAEIYVFRTPPAICLGNGDCGPMEHKFDLWPTFSDRWNSFAGGSFYENSCNVLRKRPNFCRSFEEMKMHFAKYMSNTYIYVRLVWCWVTLATQNRTTKISVFYLFSVSHGKSNLKINRSFECWEERKMRILYKERSRREIYWIYYTGYSALSTLQNQPRTELIIKHSLIISHCLQTSMNKCHD